MDIPPVYPLGVAKNNNLSLAPVHIVTPAKFEVQKIPKKIWIPAKSTRE